MKEYSVNIWGSHPEEENDDCHAGIDVDTLEEAREVARDWRDYFSQAHYGNESVAYIEIDGEDINEVIANPHYDREAAERNYRADEEEWRREAAMQAGMGLGVNAYNDLMGYDIEPYDPYIHD